MKKLILTSNDELVFEEGKLSFYSIEASENVIILNGWFIFNDGTEEEGFMEFYFEKETSIMQFLKSLLNNELKNVKTAFFTLEEESPREFEEGFYELMIQYDTARLLSNE